MALDNVTVFRTPLVFDKIVTQTFTASGRGAGGAGGNSYNSGSTLNGGSGTAGYVRITEFLGGV